ncbi:MAG: HlyD family secretion protein [Thiomicrorhabdus sp.]|nr:MAG: HlyD family secretion protein [Thiomicrorhabdus sp.]
MAPFLQSRIRTVLIPLAIIAMTIVIFVFFMKTKPEQPAVELTEKVWMVEAIEAKFERLSPVQVLYGKVESNALVQAASPVSGVVAKVWVKEGQSVKKGQSLLSLSRADLEIPLQKAKADVEDITAQLQLQQLANKANLKRLEHEQKVLELKQTTVERTQQLIVRELASLSDLDKVKEILVKQEYVVVGAELAVEESLLKGVQNQARLTKAKAALALAKLNLKRGKLIAPYDIRIAKVFVSEGSRVNVGASLVRYYGFNSLELRAKLPISGLNKMQSAVDSKVKLLAFYQLDDQQIPLDLTRLAGESTTSGLDAFFTLPKVLSNARPGDLMEVNLQGVVLNRVVAIPYSALYGQNKVYIVKEGRLVSEIVQVVGDVMREGRLWALIRPEFGEGTSINITHLPNAMTGLKVSEAE